MPEVSFSPEACLPARSPLSDCQACADACPVNALESDGARPVLNDACLRCGQCAAACPGGALRVRGFPRPGHEPGAIDDAHSPSAAATGRPLSIDCWRVPFGESPDNTLRVPCLGGLDSGTLALLSALQPHGVVLLDRGWCCECPVGGAGPPAQGAEEEARNALKAAGADEARLPHRVSRPLHRKQAASDTIPNAAGEIRVTRRALFRHIVGHAAAAAEEWQQSGISRPDDDAGGALRTNPVPPRKRLLMAMGHFTDVVPADYHPDVVVDTERCANHQVCAALCPTTALHANAEMPATGLDFNPGDCISCGLCERVCPEQALTLHSRGGLGGSVTRHQQQQCTDCRRRFSPQDPSGLCSSCRKKNDLLSGGAYELLFGSALGKRRGESQMAQGNDYKSDSARGQGGTV